MFARLLLFEGRFHLRHISFPVFAFAFLAFGYGLSGNAFGEANLFYNSTYNLHKTIALFSLVAIFFVMVQTSRVVLRDQTYRMAPLVFTTPIRKRRYLLTRFWGLFLSASGLFVFAIIGLGIGALIRDNGQGQFGPVLLSHYLWPYLVIALPNLLLVSSVLFLIANLSKNILATYLGGILLYCLYWVGAILFNSPMIAGATPATPEGLIIAALVDPFGLSAFFEQTQYWEVADRNEAFIRLEGPFLANRVLWLAIAVGILVLNDRLFSFRKAGRSTKAPKAVAGFSESRPAAYRQPTLQLRPTEFWPTFRSQLAIEWKSLWGAWPSRLAILLWMALIASEVFTRIYGGGEYGSILYPTTNLMVWLIEEPFQIFSRLLVIFFGGEIMARERLLRWKDILDSSPIPSSIQYLTKLICLISIPGLMLVGAFSMALIGQVSKGYFTFEPLQYLAQFYLLGWPLVIFSVVILFIQGLVSNKYLGMFIGLLLTILLLSGLAGSIGLEHPLLRIGIFPEVEFTNMNGFDRQLKVYQWLSVYWTSFALLLAYLSWKTWKRGRQRSPIRQFRRAFAKPNRSARWLLTGLSMLFVALMTGLYYQLNVQNTRTTRGDELDRRAAYELQYKAMDDYLDLDVLSLKSSVDLYPASGSFRIDHEYTLINQQTEPIKQQWFTVPRWFEVEELSLSNATLEKYDTLHRVYLFTMDEAVWPGDTINMNYNIAYKPRGLKFARSLRENSVVRNGTNLMSIGIVPRFGYQSDLELQDNTERLKRGLPALEETEHLPMHAGMAAEDRPSYSKFKFETTISTDLGQTAVAPGRLIRQWERQGRSYYHYKSSIPINHFYSYLSANYNRLEADVDGVDVSVYYDPGQAYNVKSILKVMQQTLEYCQDAFGPYALDHLRLLEIPGHWPMGGYATAGNIGLVEDRAFLTDLRDTNTFDVVSKRVAHEVAHQWFGHQLTPYTGAGGSVLVESTAKYIECVMQEQLHGKHQLRMLLKEEMKRYFNGRNRSLLPEPPLRLTGGQNYLAYAKGAIIMNAIRDLLGEDSLNQALRYLFDHHAYPNPKASIADFEEQLFQLASPDQRQLLADWLSKVVIYDNKILSSSYQPLQPGGYEIRLQVEVHKMELKADGKLAEIPMEENVNIGLFQLHPDELVQFSEKDRYEKHALKTGRQEIRFQVQELPAYISLDPYLHLPDKNIYDNTVQLLRN